MGMPKHLISFTRPQYTFLDRMSKKLGISVAELVRRAVDDYRARIPAAADNEKNESKEELERGFEEAFGILKEEVPGTAYKQKQRRQWKKRSGLWLG